MEWDWDETPIYESDRMRMDASLSPLVIYEYDQPSKITSDEVELMLSLGDHHLARNLPYCALIILKSGSGILGASQRRLYVDWLEARGTALERDDFSTVIMMPEAIFRAVLRVVYQFRKPPIRTLTAATPNAAAQLVHSELQRMGIPITTDIEATLSGFSV